MNKLKNITEEELSKLKLPISQMATGLSYIGPAINETHYYSWCVSAIEVNGDIHYFTAQWPKELGMGGWLKTGRIAHYSSKHPEEQPTYLSTLFCDTLFKEKECDSTVLKEYMTAPHNVRIKKIDDHYVLLFIVQTYKANERIQKIVMATSTDIFGPWDLVDNDGIILERADSGWTKDAYFGIDNHDIIKIDEEYRIYFKVFNDPVERKDCRIGYAVSSHVTGPYKIKKPVTNNYDYIEDATIFECNDTLYMLTDDNYGTHSWGERCSNKQKEGYVILWEETPHSKGTEFLIENAKIAVFQLNQYVDMNEEEVQFVRHPGRVNYKFERPSVLMIDGKPSYFIAPACVNTNNEQVTQSYILKIDTEL